MHRRLAALVAAGVFLLAALHTNSAAPNLQADGWSAPIALSSQSDWIGDVSLAVSADGTAHVVWDDGGQLFHAYGSPTVNPTPAAIAYGESPSLAGGAGSAALLAFASLAGEQYDIYVSHWDGAGWSLPTSVLPTDGDSFAPSADWNGTSGAVAWAETVEDSTEVYLSRSEDGGPWLGGAVPLAEGDAPDVCLDAQGVHVSFQARDPLTGRLDIWHTQYYGPDWSVPTAVSGMPDADSSGVRLACWGGQPHAAWQQAAEGGYNIWFAARSAEGWSLPEAASGGSDAFSPELAASAGSMHLAWAESSAVGYRPWAGDTWGAAVPLGPRDGEVLDVALDAAADGTVHLAWVEMQSDGTTQVFYSWRGSPVTPTPSTTLTRTSTPTSTPSPTPTSTATPRAVHRRFLPIVFRQSGF